MYLIDETYFIREYSIPNITEAQTEAYNDLELFVDDYARQLLRNLLGDVLFTELDTYIIDGVFVESGTPQKWINLVKGCEYNDKVWLGILQENGLFKKSIITPFVYSHWLLSKVSEMTGIGDVKLQGQNVNQVNPTQRIISTWNEFVEQYQGSCNNYPKVYFKGFTQVIDWLDNINDNNVSLTQFVSENSTDYPDAKLKMYDFKNQLGV